MKTRPTEWLDTKAMRPKHGLKVFHDGRWIDVGKDGSVLLFDTPEERDAKRAELERENPAAPELDEMAEALRQGKG